LAGAVGGTEPVTPPLLDASFVVRYLMDEPPAMADRATAVIESNQVLAIGAVTLAETAHVLRRIYGRPREQIVDALIELVQRENVVPYGLDRATLVEALRMCRPSGRVSIPDALLWAEARSSGSGVVYTFDRQFPALGIEVRS
jgi:predicted nucleic acid-binding protein